MKVAIQSLTTYPLKSAAGIALSTAKLSITGLPSDRRWMLVDDKNRFVSQRQLPEMALMTISEDESGIEVSYTNQSPLRVTEPPAGAETFRATMHRNYDTLEVVSAGNEAAEWFTRCFEHTEIGPLRLVRLRDDFQRAIPDRPEAPNQHVLLSDGYPFLIASESSLSHLNERLNRESGSQIQMNRFRPNIVISGSQAWEEMESGLALENEPGTIRFRLVKPCQRCSIPQMDPATGQTDFGPEFHRVLKEIDNAREQPLNCFGHNAVLEQGDGESLAVGQPLQLKCVE
ncbi:MAG: hypothetical protein CMO80_17525 [Verrucomicrobiales bacterium]|nr:hypothetical protein [Verrucomicrobiales bacterium]|tara:strand:+ start:231 stop:1091 length:861 start_codon:yes stop_codon:yes gene_type:complete